MNAVGEDDHGTDHGCGTPGSGLLCEILIRMSRKKSKLKNPAKSYAAHRRCAAQAVCLEPPSRRLPER